MTVAALEIGDLGLSYVNVFTNDIDKTAQLTRSQVALSVIGTIASVVGAFLPVPNWLRVEKNLEQLAKLGKGGSKDKGRDPNDGNENPADVVENPTSDSRPSDQSDQSRLDDEHEITPADRENVPEQIPPPDTSNPEGKDDLTKTPKPGPRDLNVLLNTIPGMLLALKCSEQTKAEFLQDRYLLGVKQSGPNTM